MDERVEVLREELRVRLEPGDVTVRLATSADAAAWSRAATSMFRDTFGPANKPEDLEAYLASAFSEEQQRAEISEVNSRIWLAYDREGIAGYAHVRLGAPLPAGSTMATNRSAEIARIYAERRWQGRGLGASLMRVCIATVSEWGADVLWLGVWERNPRAIAFYEKQGFVAVGEQTFLLGADLQHDFVMARRLTNER